MSFIITIIIRRVVGTQQYSRQDLVLVCTQGSLLVRLGGTHGAIRHWRNKASGALTLYVGNLESIPGTPYGFLVPTKSDN